MTLKGRPLGRIEEIVVQELKGEVLIYDLKINKAFCLNETSALVWQECRGEKSVEEISQSVGKKLRVRVNDQLVWLALEDLKKNNLLANNEEIVSDFNGMSRREVISKIGLGTMIALPVISSLVAPRAAHAQSERCTSGISCTTNADCASAPVVGSVCDTITNCCVGIPGTGCVPRPGITCPPPPGGCDPLFGC